MATTVRERRALRRETLTGWNQREQALWYGYGVADAKAGEPPQLINSIPPAVRTSYTRGYEECREAAL